MRISVLASGSKGNATFIEAGDNRILVDVGMTSLYIENKLKELDIEPSTINSIFLTHTHDDHISGLKVFIKKYNPTVYLSEKMYEELRYKIPISKYVFLDKQILLDTLVVDVFKTSHDIEDSNGYIFNYENKTVVYITDTGYINIKFHERLKNKTLYIMESNHEINLLMNGSYPHYLKQRILSDRGHLSNQDSSHYLSAFVGDETNGIILIHLSEKNNDPEVALLTLIDTLEKHDKTIETIIVAKQNEKTEMLEI